MSNSITFKEWKCSQDGTEEWYNDSAWKSCERAFNAARVGMIPEDQAVRVPDVGEWPATAKGVYMNFTSQSEAFHKSDTIWFVKYISRPLPVWVPKIGDAVFFCDTDTLFKIKAKKDDQFQLTNGWWSLAEDMKPGSIDQIGKPWGEI